MSITNVHAHNSKTLNGEEKTTKRNRQIHNYSQRYLENAPSIANGTNSRSAEI